MPNGTLSPAVQNPGYTYNIPGYGANGLTSYDLKPLVPVLSMSFDGALDIKFTFSSSENGQDLKLELAPDPTINVHDLAKIMMLTQLAQCGGIRFQADVLSYIRKHNLERHFKFTVV